MTNAKPMTVEERAEKIYEEYGRRGSWNYFDKRIIGAIAEQIQQACDEARVEAFQEAGLQQYRDRNDEADKAYAKGFSDARERAAKVAGGLNPGDVITCHCSCRSIIAELIRALERDK